MGLSEEISKLEDAQSDRLEVYQSVFKILLNNEDKKETKDLDMLCSYILQDMNNGLLELKAALLENVVILCQNESLKKLLSENSKENILKGILTLICSKEEKILALCFLYLSETLSTFKLTDDLARDLLGKITEVLSKTTVSVSLYLSASTYIQRFFKVYEEKLSSFMQVLPKLIFLPLVHSSTNIREVAEKTLNDFPRLILYSEDESFCSVLLKLMKEQYCKDLLSLFKGKQELYVLKIWKHVVNALGKTLHVNLPAMTPFFQIIEKGFKSTSDDVCKMSFIIWKCLISNFALDDAVLNDSKKLRFVLKPFKNISRSNESISLAVCDTWWHLAWSLSHNLSTRFTEVCMPMLEFVTGKPLTGPLEKTVPKVCQEALIKRGCHLLLRLLEQPPSSTLSRITSPKKYPPIVYPTLQVPLDPKVIVRYFKEISSMVKSVVEVLGNAKDMYNHIECLMKSVLFIISITIDDKSKEAVTSVVFLVADIIESQMCSPLLCLKCVDSLSKLPRSSLTSHCFNGISRKPQDILCTTLLKLLLNPYLLTKETPKRFLSAYNRLVQAGLCESLNPLLTAQRFTHCLKVAATPGTMDVDVLIDMWSGIASPLLEIVEKTQEVNQGDKREHDFTCIYDVLMCPFDHVFHNSTNQPRTKPSLQLWANLYKTFIRCASLVPTTFPNECCEELCLRLKDSLKKELLKEPHYFETVCFFLEVVLESIDSASILSASSLVSSSPSLMIKRKKPLGNLTSIVNLLSILLIAFHDHYLNSEEEIYQSCTPKAQKKNQVTKTAVPVDHIKTLFTITISGSMIPFALEQLSEPISRIFLITQRKSFTSQINSKLENLWNVLTSSIEMHYLGPYDSEFLSIMCPLLEASFSHSRRLIKERSRRFWFATFAPVSSSLKYPESLKNSLKKAKVTLFPDESMSALEDFSCIAESTSLEDNGINFNNVDLKDSFIKPVEMDTPMKSSGKVLNNSELKSTSKSLGDTSKATEVKSTPKRNIDELSSSEFVKIEISTPITTTPRRRSIRKRKSFVPALYNDLSQSQDTNTLFGGSSDSIDITSSSEIEEFKSQSETNKPGASSEENCLEEIDRMSENANIETVEICEDNKSTINKKLKTERSPEALDFDPRKKQNLKMSTNEIKNEAEYTANGNVPHCSPERDVISSKSCSHKLSQVNMINASNDSDEIIPSSQNSAENDSFKNFPALENIEENYCNIKMLTSDVSNANNIKTDLDSKMSCANLLSMNLINDKSISCQPENNESACIDECPETPADFMENNSKMPDSGISNHESHLETLMPLKSSENIQNSDEHSVKLGSLNNKSSASDITAFMDTTEKQVNITENTPPFNKTEISVQGVREDSLPEISETSQLLEKNISESEYILPPLNKNEEIIKNTKKNVGRKSLDVTVSRKTSKRIRARNSIANSKNFKKTKYSSIDDIVTSIDDTESSCAVEIAESQQQIDKNNFQSLVVKEDPIFEIKNLSENMLDLISKENISNEKVSNKRNSTHFHDNKIKKVTSKIFVETGVNADSANAPIQALSEEINISSSPFENSVEQSSVNLNLRSSNIDNSIGNTDSDICSSSFISHKGIETDSNVFDQKEELSISNTCDDEIEIIAVVSSVCSTAAQNMDDTTGKRPQRKCTKPRISKLSKARDSILKVNSLKTIEDQELKQDAKKDINVDLDPNSPAYSCNKIVEQFEFMEDINSSNDEENSELNLKSHSTKQNLNKLKESYKDVTTVDKCQETANTLTDVQCNLSNVTHDLESNAKSGLSVTASEVLHNSSKNIYNAIFNKEPNCEVITNKLMSSVEAISEHNKPCSESNLKLTPEELSPQSNNVPILNIPQKAVEHPIDTVEDLFFTDDLNYSNIVEINESGDHVLNDSENVLSVTTEDNDHFETTDQKPIIADVDVVPIVNDLLCKVDFIASGDAKFSDSQSTPDFLELTKTDLIISSDSDSSDNDKISDSVSSLLLSNSKLSLSSEVTCFPISPKEKSPLKCANIKQNIAKEEKSSSKKRKGKCPKRTSCTTQGISRILVAKSNVSPEKMSRNFSKLTISKLGKRSMQKDPSSSKERNISISFMKSSEMDVCEIEGNNKNLKKCLISSQVLGKTGLEIKRTESYHNFKNTKELRNEELTDMNTRFNASSGTETRRYKMLAASQQSFETIKQIGCLSYSVSSESNREHEDANKSSSILKKRKASDDSTAVKVRKVTFADPLVEEKLFRTDDSIYTTSTKRNSEINGKGVEIEVGNISLPEIVKITKPTVILTPISLDNISSSYEYQNSDTLATYNASSVSPALINCKDSVSCILKDLTSPAWIRGLETLLLSKNITTIGDLCKLNMHELKALPFKSPKLQSLHNALFSYIIRTQKEVAEKFKEIDDFSDTDNSSHEFSETTADNINKVAITDENDVPDIFARLTEELLENDNIKHVPKSTLIALSKKCINELTERLENA